MFKGIDNSPQVAVFIKNLSAWLSKRRGLPLLVGIVLTVVSLILHLIAALVPTSGVLLFCANTVLHIAILFGFIGILLWEPLGRG